MLGIGNTSSIVSKFRALKSITGLKLESALGTSSRGLEYRDVEFSMIPLSSIALISLEIKAFLECGTLYAGILKGLAPGTSSILCSINDVLPKGLISDGKTSMLSENNFDIHLSAS